MLSNCGEMLEQSIRSHVQLLWPASIFPGGWRLHAQQGTAPHTCVSISVSCPLWTSHPSLGPGPWQEQVSSSLHTGCLVVLSHLLGKGNSDWEKSYDSHSPRVLSLCFTAMNALRATQVPGFWAKGACAEGRGAVSLNQAPAEPRTDVKVWLHCVPRAPQLPQI